MSTKKKSISKRSKLMILLGFLCFVNPTPFGLDVIPDVIGCALLFFGLTQLSFFDGAIEEARKYLLYLFAVEAVHILLMRPMLLTNIGSNRMLGVTALAIVQGIVYLLFFKKLFSGISYFAMRNNCNETLKLCDGSAFMSYLAFYLRIAAMLLPELIAIIELYLYTEIDIDTTDAITAFVSAKPIIVLLLSAISLAASVSWFVSIRKLFVTLHKECGDEIDKRYSAEYSSRPEKTRPKRVRAGGYAFCFSLVFAVDLSFDSIKILPASFMFLFWFASAFVFKGISGFNRTKKLAIPAFLLLLGTEIYKMLLVPYGAVVIYETELYIVIIGTLLAVATMIACMLCVRGLLDDASELSQTLGGKAIEGRFVRIAYTASALFWAAGFAVPFFYPYVSTARLIASGIFIWQTARIFTKITEEEYERSSLYG